MRIVLAAVAALVLAACGSPGKPAADPGIAAANLKAGQEFLAANAKVEGVRTTASGLQYKVIRSGPADGLRPKASDEVKVHYEGKLLNGEVFDSSFARGAPVAFPLEGLIPGWVEALQLMRPGDEWMLYIPARLAYGAEDKGGGVIPGNSVLIFRIQLIAVLPHGDSIQRG